MEPSKTREHHRVTLVQPIVMDPMPQGEGIPIGDHILMEDLQQYLTDQVDLLPRVMANEPMIEGARVGLDSPNVKIDTCCLKIINVRADSYVTLVTFDFTGDYLAVIEVLKAQVPAKIMIDGKELGDHLGHMELVSGEAQNASVNFGTERHQLVFFVPQLDETLGFEVAQKLIYREDAPLNSVCRSIDQPSELNLRAGSEAYLGVHVSILIQQNHYVENSVLLSTIMIVSSQARLHALRKAALLHLKEAARENARSETIVKKTVTNKDWTTRRHRLAALSADLRDLQVSLSFDVEDNSTIADLIPCLRLEAFHRSLWTSLKIDEQVGAASKMLSRLENAVAAEEQTIAAVQQKKDEWRRITFSLPLGVITFVAVPVGLMLSYFSGKQKGLIEGSPFVDVRYFGIYMWIFSVLAFAVALGLGLWLWGRRQTQNMASRSDDSSRNATQRIGTSPVLHG